MTVVLMGLGRLHTYHEPLSRDISTYMVIGQQWLAGRPLYSDLWDIKPPATYLTYATAQVAAGFGPAAVYLLSLLASTLTMLGVFFAARQGARWWATPVLAAALFAIVSTDLRLQANEPNSEVFMNACLVWAFVILVGAPSFPSSLWRPAGSGLLLGIASTYKTVVVAHALLIGAAVVFLTVRGGRTRTVITHLATMAAAAALPWIAVFIGFALSGGTRDLIDAVFVYNMGYASSAGGGVLSNVIAGFSPPRLIPPFTRAVWPLLLFILLGLVVSRPLRLTPRLVLLVAYAVASHIALALPGHFWPHYYQLWLPPLCIAAAWSVDALSYHSLIKFRLVRPAAAGILLAMVVGIQLPLYALDPEQASVLKYGNDPLDQRDVGLLAGRILEPGESMYQWGTATGLYYAARARPAAGAFFLTPLLPNPIELGISARTVAQLDENPPTLVVLDARDTPIMRWSPVAQWIQANYEYLGRDALTGRFAFYGRTGLEMSRRIQLKVPDEIVEWAPEPAQLKQAE